MCIILSPIVLIFWTYLPVILCTTNLYIFIALFNITKDTTIYCFQRHSAPTKQLCNPSSKTTPVPFHSSTLTYSLKLTVTTFHSDPSQLPSQTQLQHLSIWRGRRMNELLIREEHQQPTPTQLHSFVSSNSTVSLSHLTFSYFLTSFVFLPYYYSFHSGRLTGAGRV